MAQTVAPPQVQSGVNVRRAVTRARIVGVIGVLIAILLSVAVARNVGADETTRLNIPRSVQQDNGLAQGVRGFFDQIFNVPADASASTPLFRITLPTVGTVIVVQALLALGGLYIAIRQPVRWIAPYVSTLIGAAFFTILLWAVAGSSVDFVDVLARVVRFAAPITLGAMAGLVCERSGVINIGIEGTMLFAACFGFVAAMTTGNTWLGVGAAMLTGCVVAALHALLAVIFKVDQTIAGTVINLLAVGTTGYVRGNFIVPFQQRPDANITAQALPAAPIPGLAQIPIIGPILFNHQPITYLMLILVFVVNLILFRTVLGLRTRAVGEQPKAADTVGINVNRLRFWNVVASGTLSGLAGAWFSLEATFRFDDVMTNGRGFIALAAMIFGKWTPTGAFGGALLFASGDALQIKIQSYQFGLPIQFLQMLPYIVTLIVLAGIIGRARPPAAVGKPHEKR